MLATEETFVDPTATVDPTSDVEDVDPIGKIHVCIAYKIYTVEN